MRRLLALALLLLPLAASAQRARTGFAPIRPGAGPAPVLPFTETAPMLAEDAGTVAHLYWNGSALVDTRGNSWSMNGTVPQVATGTPFTPEKPGAGPYTSANNYQGPTTIMDWAGDWNVTVVFSLPQVVTNQILIAKFATPNAGWRMYVDASSTCRVQFWGGAGTFYATTATISSSGQPVIVCTVGRSGGTIYAAANESAVGSSVVPAMIPATAEPVRIGRYGPAGNEATDTTIYEILASSQPFTASLHQARFRQVFAAYTTTTQPITVTRASDQAYRANGKIWGVGTNVVPVGPNGLESWKGSTNSLRRSNAISTGTAATPPWALTAATVTTTTGGAPDGRNWAEVTSSTNVGAVSQTATTPSSTTFSGGAAVVRASGSAVATATVRCGGAPAACTCYPTAVCTASTGGVSANDCNAKATVAQTVIDLGVNVTCPAAITNPTLILYPGDAGVSTGTARFSIASLEATTTYPTPPITTFGSTTSRAATVASVPLPDLGNRWCVSVTATPGSVWSTNAGRTILNSGVYGSPNTWALYATGGTTLRFDLDDSSGNQRIVSGLHGFGATTTAQRITACNNQGALAMCVNGVAFGSASGAGTALQSATTTPLELGHGSSTAHFDGAISNVNVCRGATKCSDCR